MSDPTEKFEQTLSRILTGNSVSNALRLFSAVFSMGALHLYGVLSGLTNNYISLITGSFISKVTWQFFLVLALAAMVSATAFVFLAFASVVIRFLRILFGLETEPKSLSKDINILPVMLGLGVIGAPYNVDHLFGEGKGGLLVLVLVLLTLVQLLISFLKKPEMLENRAVRAVKMAYAPEIVYPLVALVLLSVAYSAGVGLATSIKNRHALIVTTEGSFRGAVIDITDSGVVIFTNRKEGSPIFLPHRKLEEIQFGYEFWGEDIGLQPESK